MRKRVRSAIRRRPRRPRIRRRLWRLGLGSLDQSSPPVRLGHVMPPAARSDCCDTPYHRRSRPGCGSPTLSSVAAMAVSMIVVVSPTSAPCSVPPRAGLHVDGMFFVARCVRPSFIFVTFASPSSLCSRSSSSASEVAPEPRAWASRSPRPSRDPPETPGRSRQLLFHRRVASSACRMVLPFSRPASTSRCCTHVKIDLPAPRARNRRDDLAPRPRPTAESCVTANESVARHAIPSRCLRSADQHSARVPSWSAHHARRTGRTGLDEPIEVVPIKQRRQPRVE